MSEQIVIPLNHQFSSRAYPTAEGVVAPSRGRRIGCKVRLQVVLPGTLRTHAIAATRFGLIQLRIRQRNKALKARLIG